MKRIILSIVLSGFALILVSQHLFQSINILAAEEDTIGTTYYDLQTNASCQNRLYVYDDGTIGATWTIGMNPTAFEDRGTGYNYFEGSSWQPLPTVRIESQRCGWPSYAPFGSNGEIIVAHYSGTGSGVKGLAFSKRVNKGTGDWEFFDYHSPEPAAEYLWPRMITSGTDHSVIHVIALTMPVANGGIIYHGLNGALLYSRSTDGGESWDIQHQILPGMDSTQYTGFTIDCYAFAEPKNNIIAFVVGSYQHDLFLMKSVDYGQSFEKTLIWDHPYDSLTPTVPTDTFYCVDGSIAVTLDMNGMAHVVFGICRTWFQLTAPKWRFNKLTDGVGYWNENMTGFSSNPNALDPSCGPESELVQDVSLIGWSQDVNGNGTWDILGDWPPYPCNLLALGVSSMVQLVADNQNRLFLVFSSITETYNNGTEDYRRLWLRSSLDGGQTWGKFYHYDGENPNSIFNEYAFPSCASFSDNYLYLTFMVDWEPGISCQGEPYYHENNIRFAKIPKDSIVGFNQSELASGFDVSQNFPNPFSQSAIVKVNLKKPAHLTLDVMNLLGQKVLQTQTMYGKQGVNHLTIEKNNLSPGIYFYAVQSGEQTITKKMILR